MKKNYLPEEFYFRFSTHEKGTKILKKINENKLMFFYSEEKIIEPSPQDWELFWENIEKIGIWDLEENYNLCTLFKGYSWEIYLAKDNKIVKSQGSNSNPSLYMGDKLILILDKFLDFIYDLTEIEMD
jgi:hypothetical protein